MEFNPETALAYARAIARPRLVGSGEDEKVAREIVDRLDSFGYRVEREPFQCTRAFEFTLAVEITLALGLVLLALLWPSRVIALGCGILLLGLLLLARPLNRAVHIHAVAPPADSGEAVSPLTALCLRLGRRYRTANIIARLPNVTGARPDAPHLYLVSHFDSKSQRLPIVLRIALFVLFIPAVLCFALLALAQSLAAYNLLLITDYRLLLGFGLFTLLTGLPLLFLDIGNASPGAIDNASGTGLLLHLAECLRAYPDLLKNIQLTLLVTSAEELGTLGALYHVRRQAALLREQAQRGGLAILNFDGIGAEGDLYLAGSASIGWQRNRSKVETMPQRLQRAAAELQIPLRRFSLTGALFDHMPFAEAGFEAASLLTIGRASWQVHTARDNVAQLHPRGFALAGRLALKLIERLAVNL